MVVIICFPLRFPAIALPITAKLSDSVPPDVKKISFSDTLRIPAKISFACLKYFSATIPFGALMTDCHNPLSLFYTLNPLLAEIQP